MLPLESVVILNFINGMVKLVDTLHIISNMKMNILLMQIFIDIANGPLTMLLITVQLG